MGAIAAHIGGRLATALPVLIGATLIAFLLGVIAPGDPAREALSQGGGLEPSIEQLAAMREQLGLDAPLPVQYAAWLGRVVQGDFGQSYITRQPVAEELLRRLPVTLQLATWAVFIAAFFGIGGGMVMGYFHGGAIDHAGRVFSLALLSIPGFWLAILLILVFAEILQVLPTSGYGTWQQMILPAVVLSSSTAAMLMRLSRAVMLEVMSQPYIITARAKGLSEPVIVVRHALRNMLIPLVTVIGNHAGEIFGGAIVVEVIFALPGLGRLAVSGIFQRDYPVIQGYVLVAAFVYIAFNLLIDLLYTLIHPQIRFGGGIK